ncbi:hypothetical protein MKK55_13055 [Methylobacterium sp. J-059]|uniref:hypothetical protein n=1 Tax=Methylobacterium sp. J-059 TaxID=2836643 RepID=UPI001FB947A5|nr:hypothetical protein [Methylobacterium sp. J-059]MCJ2039858.1 hypothetical protein [Methylobacterium sp. J-059]
MIYQDDTPVRIKGTIYWAALLLFLGYQLCNFFVPNSDMILAARVMAAGFYAVVLYVYGPDAWRALWKNDPISSDYLIVGIWLSFASHLGQTAYSIAYRLAPSDWFLNSEIVSFIIMGSVVGAALHICAPGSLDGQVPRRNRIALGIGVGIATLVVGLLLVTRPDIRPLIERTRPYIGDWFHTGALRGIGEPPA